MINVARLLGVSLIQAAKLAQTIFIFSMAVRGGLTRRPR